MLLNAIECYWILLHWTQLPWIQLMLLRYTDAVAAGHTLMLWWKGLLQLLNTICCCCWKLLTYLLHTAVLNTAAVATGHSCCCCWTQLLLLLVTGDVISGYYCCCWICMRYTAAIVELIFMTLFHVKVMFIITSTCTSLMKARDRIRTRKKSVSINDLCKST